MVSVNDTPADPRDESAASAGPGLRLRIDGTQPISMETVKAVQALCDQAEDHAAPGIVTIYVSGAPRGAWARDINTALVTKWERALRRLERLAMTTVAAASGDCGGSALDTLLVTDFRVGTTDLRLSVPVHEDATWPGMTIYRLTQQAGLARIRRAVLFGIHITGGEALALRLIDELVDDLEVSLAAIAERSGVYSGKELAIRRQLMFDATTTSFEDALGSHLAACDRALRRSAVGIAP